MCWSLRAPSWLRANDSRFFTMFAARSASWRITWSGSASDDGTSPASARKSLDRKSTRLNSSHSQISYAVFCLKKKKTRGEAPHGDLRQDGEVRTGLVHQGVSGDCGRGHTS